MSGLFGGALCATLYSVPALCAHLGSVFNMGAIFLSLLSLLPLFLVGLCFGRKSLIIAVLVSSLINGVAMTPQHGIVHFFMNGLPIILIVDRLLNMKDPLFLDEIIAWIIGVGAFMTLIQSFDPLGMTELMSKEMNDQNLTPSEVHSPEEVRHFFTLIMSYMPGFFAMGWCGNIIINISLAQGVLTGIEKSMVATPSLKDLKLSKVWLIPLIICLSLSFVGAGFVTLLAQNLLFVLFIPFLLQGLAPIHGGLSKGQLIFFYCLLALFFSWALLFVAFAGIIITLRRKTAL